MIKDEVLHYFIKEYPGKNIVLYPEDEPMEIICEVEPSSLHTGSSTAIAAIKKSKPHYHKLAVERYSVLKGELKLNVSNRIITLNKGDEYTVQPGELHSAEGDYTLVRVKSTPGWISEDHFLV